MEKSAIEQYIFFAELMKVGFPFNFLTSESVGPALAQFGSDELKQELIPKILAGEINICIGYSEPGSGTDLASMKTKAVEDGDYYIINGQKMWTSLAEWADYVWLACRTGDVETQGKHGSISMFLIPMDTPGISVTPVWTLGSVRTNATYYENVRVHKSRIVGQLNQGWQIITSQLNRERLALVTHGPATKIFKSVCEYAAKTQLPNGERLIDQDWVKMNLAKARQGIEAMRLICYKQAWAIATTGTLDMAEASAAKIFGSEFLIETIRGMMEILGQASALHPRSEATVLNGELERLYRTLSILTFGGGTNEIQRDLISIFGLNMPRPLRA
jgi:alkylation response protein AidB-like acyl-CoA dehydrogenase